MAGDFRSLPFPMQLQLMRRAQAEEQARKQAGASLYGMFPEETPAVPTPPPGSMSPGGGNPALQPQQPVQPQPQQPQGMPPLPGDPSGPRARMMAGPQPQPQRGMPPMPKIAPFSSLPAAQGPSVSGGEIPAPPGAAAAPSETATPGVAQPKPFDLRSMVMGLRKSGVPSEKVMDMLDQLAPVMTAANRQELDNLKVTTNAERAAAQAYRQYVDSESRRRDTETREREAQRKKEQGEQRIEIAKLKLHAAVGGDKNLKQTEIIYPKDAQGKPDMNQSPLGVRGVTKRGQIIYLDMDGKQVNQLAGVSAKEAKQVKVTDTVRSNIVGAGVTNAINRLDEIEQKFPSGTTSLLFGKSAGGVIEGAGHALIRNQQNPTQQEIDAKWASFIDEAIPVFTGGLRGSDAFRRFLIEQAPQPGTKPEVVKEKMRLFRQNIEGTRRAFFDKFASDKSMWGPGVTKEQVEAARKGGGAASAANPAAPGAGGLSAAEQSDLERLRKKYGR